MENEKKIYVGSGTEFGKFGDININVYLSDLPKEWIKKSKKNGKNYINLVVSKRKEKGQYGETHAVTVNTFVPEKKQPKNEKINDDIPF